MNFRIDNTEGFTEQELAAMNEAYEKEVLYLDPASSLFLDRCQAIEERICDQMNHARAISGQFIMDTPDIFRWLRKLTNQR